MSGKNAKVIQFPNATRKRIVCQYLSGTTIEPFHSRKESKDLWPTILGVIVGLLYVSLLFLL